MENLHNTTDSQVASTGSDVDMIEVHTPNFFERHFLHILTIFGVGFLLFTFIFQIYLTPIYIVGRSMQPTINQQSTGPLDQTHCDLVYYTHTNKLTKGDVVVVDASDYLTGQTDPIIKRVVATAGDSLTFDIYKVEVTTLVMQDLHVYKCYYTLELNGTPLVEDYVNETECYLEVKTNVLGEYKDNTDYKFTQLIYQTLHQENPSKYIKIGKVSTTIPQNCVFVCGDNRNLSTDSRYFGEIKTSDVLGKMAIHIPYGTNFFVGLWREIFS